MCEHFDDLPHRHLWTGWGSVDGLSGFRRCFSVGRLKHRKQRVHRAGGIANDRTTHWYSCRLIEIRRDHHRPGSWRQVSSGCPRVVTKRGSAEDNNNIEPCELFPRTREMEVARVPTKFG